LCFADASSTQWKPIRDVTGELSRWLGLAIILLVRCAWASVACAVSIETFHSIRRAIMPVTKLKDYLDSQSVKYQDFERLVHPKVANISLTESRQDG
jgi:hypothetical protein